MTINVNNVLRSKEFLIPSLQHHTCTIALTVRGVVIAPRSLQWFTIQSTTHHTGTTMGASSRNTAGRGVIIPLILVVFVALWAILDEAGILKHLSPSLYVFNTPRVPRLALLITFPNSGTSYTITTIQKVTQLATASNYVGEVSRYDSHPNVTVYPDHPEGPFWRGSSGTLPPLPNTTVLVKTHCTGYDLNNGIFAYKLSHERFAGGCRYTATTSNASHHGRYPANLVDRLVHIVRNPYDNFISRFHHEYNRRVPVAKNGNEGAIQWTLTHSKNQTGFQQFCRDLNADFTERYKPEDFPSDLYTQIQQTMCHDEVIQYITWHNGAFATSEILKVPTLVFHYEDYQDNFNETISNLLEFLELPRSSEPLAFHSGHGYERDYFPEEDRENIKKLANMLATTKTWDAIERYFD